MGDYKVTDWVSEVVGTLAEATAAYETKLEDLDSTNNPLVRSGIIVLPRRGFQAFMVYTIP